VEILKELFKFLLMLILFDYSVVCVVQVPILGWLPSYTSEDAVSDLVAGVTVGLTVIPQGIAYANVAGIPPQVSPTPTVNGISRCTRSRSASVD
jgi:hypothetical protein